MAKVRTSVYLPPQTWSGTLVVADQSQCLQLASAPTKNVSVSAIGGAVHVDGGGAVIGPPLDHEPDDPPPPGQEPPEQWYGNYFQFTVTASAPSSDPLQPNQESKDVFVWVGDNWGPGLPNIPDDAIIVRDTFTIAFVISVSGVYLKMWLEEAKLYSDGGILAFTERVLREVWSADENATVTVTATLPDNSTLQVSGPLAEAGQEIELGTNFALTLGFTQHRYDVTDTVYAAFQDVK